MLIRYKIYRSKNPDEIFNSEMIKWNIENDKDLIEIDRRVKEVLAYHIQNLPEIKKYGTAYIGRTEIVSLEITDEDNLGGLTEEYFRAYLASEEVGMKYYTVIWSQTTNINKEQKPVKSKNKDNKEE